MNTTNNRNDFYKEQLGKTLNGNEKIETAIAALQKEATEEMLAHTLTVIRHRMQEQAQLIIAVEPPKGDGKISLHAIKTNDGKQWWAAFTSFDEELKGSDKIMSTFTADIDKIFASALQEPSVEGVILNPWNRTLMLNKTPSSNEKSVSVSFSIKRLINFLISVPYRQFLYLLYFIRF